MFRTFFSLLPVLFLTCAPLMAGDGRPEVDELARLMAMRLALAREVAWSKCCQGLAVADPAREAALLTALKEKGRAFSMTSERVTAFFLPQIVASRRYQDELIRQWRGGFPCPKNQPLDIRAELRPRIDRLDADMLRLWAAFPADMTDEWSRDRAESILRERGIPAEVARIASRPLSQGLGPGSGGTGSR